MQNLRTIYDNLKQNKPLFFTMILLGAGIVILFGTMIFRAVADNKERVYNDPLSGETVYNPTDRTPETYGQPLQITYLGFTGLIDRGVSFEAVQNFKDQLAPIKVSGKKVTEISIDVDTIQHSITSDSDTYTFRIRFNRKDDYKTDLKINKSDDSLTFDFSGDNVDAITFN